MAGFKAALINEIEKLCKKKKVLVATIISLIVIVLGQVAISGMRSGFGLRGASNMEFPILVLSVVVNSILPLFTALIAIDCFSAEFSQNTMKITLTRPVSRLKFFAAKLTAILLFILVNLFFVMIFSLVAGVIFNSNSFTFLALIKIFICYIVTVFPMMILAMVIVLFTNIIRSGVGVFFISIFVFIIFKVIGIMFSQYSGILFTSMLDWYNLWIMSTFPFAKILRQFILMCSYGIILFTGSFYLLDKKDF